MEPPKVHLGRPGHCVSARANLGRKSEPDDSPNCLNVVSSPQEPGHPHALAHRVRMPETRSWGSQRGRGQRRRDHSGGPAHRERENTGPVPNEGRAATILSAGALQEKRAWVNGSPQWFLPLVADHLGAVVSGSQPGLRTYAVLGFNRWKNKMRFGHTNVNQFHRRQRKIRSNRGLRTTS